MKDYYYILGIERNATIEQIKEAYRKLSKKFHPDLNPNDSHSEKMFKDIQEAYEVLSNTNKRSQYDNAYSSWSNSSYQSNKNEYKTNDTILDVENDKNSLSIAIALLLITGYFVVQFIISQTNSQNDKENKVLYGVIGAVALCIFMAPFLIATWKKNPLKWGVFAANLVLGWTGLGWIGCLVFAFYQDKK